MEPTSPQFALLSAVAWHPGIDQGSAGAVASLDTSTTADVVSRLARKGWLWEDTDSRDGRRKRLHLDEDAKATLGDLTNRAAAVQNRLLEPLDDAEVPSFLLQLGGIAYEGSPPEADEPPGSVGLSLSQSPGHLIRRAQQVHLRHWTAILDGEITGPQYAVLCVVATQGPVDQVTIEKRAGVDRSTVGQIIGRLVRRRDLIATRHRDDRRRKQLVLSDATNARLADLSHRAQQVQDRLLELVPPHERERFMRQLRGVARMPHSETHTASSPDVSLMCL